VTRTQESGREKVDDILALCFINWAETLERLEMEGRPRLGSTRNDVRLADKKPTPDP
jgi:hypothetical protein